MSEDDWEEIMGKDIMMKRLKAGQGEIASMGSVVMCDLTGYILSDNGRDKDPFEILFNEQFKIGEGDAFPGLELTLRHSRVGETFAMKCSARFAFGATGRPIEARKPQVVTDQTIQDVALNEKPVLTFLPPNSDLYYEVHVTKHQNEGDIDHTILQSIQPLTLNDNDITSTMEIPDSCRQEYHRLVTARDINLRKDCGNRWFSYHEYQRAARAYSKGTQLADNYFKAAVPAPEGELAAEDSDLGAVPTADLVVVNAYVACLNNLSACYLGLGENLKAKDMCVKVLEFDPSNVKALLRAAKATLAMHDFLECEVCLKRLLELSPCNAAALAEVSKLKRAKKEYALRSKEIQRNMAKRLFNGKSGDNANNPASVSDSPLPQAAGPPDSGEGSPHIPDGESTPSSTGSSGGNDQISNNSSDSRMKGAPAVPVADKTTISAAQQAKPPSIVKPLESSSTNNAVAAAAAGDLEDTAAAGEKTGAAAVAAAAAYSGLDTGNVVVLLVTSLIVLAISVYIALFASRAAAAAP